MVWPTNWYLDALKYSAIINGGNALEKQQLKKATRINI